jgi:MFS family permease
VPKTTQQVPVVPRRSWRALIVLNAAMFMALLDTTIVNVALPTIRTDLDASEATLSSIISGYALAFGIALIPAGWGSVILRRSHHHCSRRNPVASAHFSWVSSVRAHGSAGSMSRQ